jgi:hypothetical protein
MDAMETISDISMTSTLEVKFERSLDQLEAAWDVSGKPNDIPVWEQEENDYLRLVEMEEKRKREHDLFMKQMEEQESQNRKDSSNSNKKINKKNYPAFKPKKIPPPPSPPICEVLKVTFRLLEHLESHALSNPEELCRVLEDHVATTMKLSTSPYALPFEKRLQQLRSLQDSFLDFIFICMEMQRT